MRELAAQEVRRGLLNKIPNSLRNCVNKELLAVSSSTFLNGSNNNNNNGQSINSTTSSCVGNSNNSAININSMPSTSPPNMSAGLGALAGNPLVNPLLANPALAAAANPQQLLAQLSRKF